MLPMKTRSNPSHHLFQTATTRLRRWLLEDQGLGSPPNNRRDTGYIRTETYHDEDGEVYSYYSVFAKFCNDAFEIWIGEKHVERDQTDETWKFHCRTHVFRRIALWYLWRWAWGEWFGLRRWLYYKWLCDWRHSAQNDERSTNDVHV